MMCHYIGLTILAICTPRPADTYITYIEAKYPLKGTPSPPGCPWPLPQNWIKSDEVFTLHPEHFKINIVNATSDCDILNQAVDRCRRNIFIDPQGTAASNHTHLYDLYVEVEDYSCGFPKFGDSENYTIEIPVDPFRQAKLKAPSVWGALRGLETLSQLVYQNSNRSYLINASVIADWPEFKYRGLLLDTARHFVPTSVLLHNLDAMSYNKFNVFHWHIVDDQSFPFESKLYPNLTKLAAYSPHHVYTQEDIRTVINAARLRGIRVIPEVDTPGHTQGFGKAFPDLLTTCYSPEGVPFTEIYGKHAKAEILNPILNQTYDFFKSFFTEIRDVFPDEYIHLGMDEVYYDCWQSNPDIAKFMQEKGFVNVSQVEQYYVRRTLDNVRDIGYKYMTWQDPVDNGVKLADDAIVQVWKDTELVSRFKVWQEYVSPIVQKGYSIILSSCWYLNYISYGEDWKKYYSCDPRDFNGTEEEKSRVVGGEACMWGEYVDGTNILSRLWPRASAVAERLWSNPSLTNDTDDAQYRLDEHRCRMMRRGIPAQPTLNGFCGDYDWDLFATSGQRSFKATVLSIESFAISLLSFLLMSIT